MRVFGCFIFACVLMLASACGHSGDTARSTPDGLAGGPAGPSTQTPATQGRYVSADGSISIDVLSGFTLFVGQRPSVDGVLASMPRASALQRTAEPSVVVTLQRLEVAEGTSLEEFLERYEACAAAASGREETTIDGTAAVLIRDTPCGPFGGSTYALVRHKSGYLIQVEHRGSFADVEMIIGPVLATLHLAE